MGSRPKRHFIKESIQIASRYLKKCWTSPITEETQSETTGDSRLAPRGLFLLEGAEMTGAGESVERRDPVHRSWVGTLIETSWKLLKKLNL